MHRKRAKLKQISQIRVVLVQPQHPGNIGAAARAMKTMGLHELYLVQPQAFPSPKAVMMAVHAADVLEQAVISESLESAIADCALAIATTARVRSKQWPQLEPTAACRRLLEVVATGETVRAALVFGPEATGLTSQQVYACQAVTALSTDSGASSLNLAQAVQVFCYELRRQLCESQPQLENPRREGFTTVGDLEEFYAQVAQLIDRIGFARRPVPHLMRNFRRIFNRADLSAREVSMLRGLLREVDERLERVESHSGERDETG